MDIILRNCHSRPFVRDDESNRTLAETEGVWAKFRLGKVAKTPEIWRQSSPGFSRLPSFQFSVAPFCDKQQHYQHHLRRHHHLHRRHHNKPVYFKRRISLLLFDFSQLAKPKFPKIQEAKQKMDDSKLLASLSTVRTSRKTSCSFIYSQWEAIIKLCSAVS